MEFQPVRLHLDISKEPGERRDVFLRQGERRAVAIEASIFDGGRPVDLARYEVSFEMRHPKSGAHLQDTVTDVDDNMARYVICEQAAHEVGTVDVAYFSLSDEAGLYATTQAFGVVVLPNAQGDGNTAADSYSSKIEAMLKECADDYVEAEARRDAESAASVARADAAARRANDAADLVAGAVDGVLEPVFDDYLERKYVFMTNEEIDALFA